jgi:dTDP-4-amino-4,6-dideoxygalactose transaminase
MSIDEVKGILAESDCRYIIPVHLYGQVISVELFDFIKTYYKNDAATVEDACQAHGAMYVESGKRVGSIGDCGCFSFYPGKNLGGFGDGGIVTTNNQLIYEKLKMLRDYGQEKKYYHTEEGYNMRLDTLQAAILRVKLKYLDKWNLNRISLAELYDKKLQDIKQIQIPKQVSHHIYHLYVIRVERRDELLNFLYKERDIQCGLHYPIPLHLQRVYDGLNYEIGDFPIAEMVAKEIISLPMHPMLTEDQIDDIVLGIKAFYAR